MIDYLIALATVTLAWWMSTGVVLLLNRQGPTAQRLSLLGVSALAFVSLIYVPERSVDRSALGALLGFGQGLVLWAWLEMTYLMGVVTGPRKTACPDGASLSQRFWLGLQTSLYHELAVIALVLSVLFLSAGGENQVAAATCVSLWLMRWSAKLNLFLGVRNYNSDWFPEHLHYLDSYTRRAPMNLLFPLSVTAGTTVAVLLLAGAMASSDPFLRAANLLVSALLSLAVLEHWFLMYPFGESALWRWALPQNSSEAKPSRESSANSPRAELHSLPLGKVDNL
ncbi:MAG: putative photosynthetic complex assembly protein PuhE [Halieaceae bacterium]|jgi:putative photosynthetic complex assembly protein 2|nr:putative photosynthetic complex assembly protein PuhE [Halieaceae bacterium]